MWDPVKKEDGESMGLTANTVGELMEMLKHIPDDYELSVTGVQFGILVRPDEKVVLIDEVSFLKELLEEPENTR